MTPPTCHPPHPLPLRVALVGFPLVQHHNTLSLGYLKAYADSILKDRVDIRIFEYGKAFGDIIAPLVSFSPHIVGFSCQHGSTAKAIKLSIKLKKALPLRSRPLIVLGGPDAVGHGSPVLLESKASALVFGEGESTFVELLERFCSKLPWEGTPGAWVRKGRNLIQGGPRKFIEKLDDIPSPYLAGLYRYGDKPYTHLAIETSRGCPRDCSFCTWTYKKSRIRNFSLSRVRAEVEWIVRNAPNDTGTEIFVCDANIEDNPGRAAEIYKMIRNSSKKFLGKWQFQADLCGWNEARARLVNFDKFAFEIGVDSLNKTALEIAHRKFDMDLLERNLAICRKHAPKAQFRIELMYGMPGDTLESYRRTMDWAWQKDLPCYFFRTMILPGSRYHSEAGKLGISYESKPPYFVTSLPGFSGEEIDHAERLSVQMTVMMSRPSSKKLLRDLAGRHGGSVTKAFEKAFPGLSSPLKQILNNAWRNYRRLAPLERARIDWGVAD